VTEPKPAGLKHLTAALSTGASGNCEIRESRERKSLHVSRMV